MVEQLLENRSNCAQKITGKAPNQIHAARLGFGYSNSQWLQAGVGYLAFQFDVGNGTQYGFAELVVEGIPDNRATFVRYAYGDPGFGVFAGTSGGFSSTCDTFHIVPEPTSLGLLALGSSGLLAWRRKRKA